MSNAARFLFSDQPGECPKCGMTLVKTEDHGHTESSANMTAYTCPMPEDSVFSDKPEFAQSVE
ncbi:MAG: hypothetical protein IPG48_09600 [Saprospiraceae bacterium]|nr:hypothetical protein [Saprospiraceae bacterium]